MAATKESVTLDLAKSEFDQRISELSEIRKAATTLSSVILAAVGITAALLLKIKRLNGHLLGVSSEALVYLSIAFGALALMSAFLVLRSFRDDRGLLDPVAFYAASRQRSVQDYELQISKQLRAATQQLNETVTRTAQLVDVAIILFLVQCAFVVVALAVG